ncbi:serine/threonine-protein kinase [Actinomycetospora lemnae]|uniref:non-specific serine/threonine protein kinase n=1 Tax=Actinomycetospora lemnae TaxID=3019891 RepID=A0ABT5SM40_9PSEU|nr:serine/threonine-protein kinase [Actinomycetospora sp. DW7H6]MDD7963900.1 serine/threonine-protein kinase [Actinomycetospora sp. DW7H6]
MAAELGPYRLGRLLGRGGMGEVFHAWDTRRARWVALKLLHPRFGADEAYRQRFRREAEAAAELREPHVVPVHDYGEIDGQLYLDMRLIDGTDLATLLRSGPLEPRRAVGLITQVAAALDAAHAAGLVHRDVKPSNVLVGPDDFAHLTDFGIARPAGSMSVAENGMVIGTLAYMAPERLRAEPADARSDVYALACVLHACLTGTAPFGEGDSSALVGAHLYLSPPVLPDDVPAALGEVVARGMAKDPAARYPRAGALAADAAAALRRRPTAPLDPPEPEPEPTEPEPADRLAVPRRWSMPAPWPLPTWFRRALVVALVALLVVVGVSAVRRYTGTGISIGVGPVAVAFTASGAEAVIANAGSRTVSVLDVRGRTVVTEILLGAGRTVGAVPDAAGEQLFVTTTQRAGDELVVVDLRRSAVAATIPLPEPTVGAPVVDARRTTVFVPVRSGVVVVDLATGRVTGRLDRGATGLAPSADGTRLLGVDDRRSTADVVDVRTGAPARSIRLGAPAHLAVAAPDGEVVYLGSADPRHALTVVDPDRATPIDEVALPGPVTGLAVSRDGDRVFATLATDPPVLAAVDTATEAVTAGWFVEEFADSVALAVSPDGTEVWIANTDLGTLTIDDVSRPPS